MEGAAWEDDSGLLTLLDVGLAAAVAFVVFLVPDVLGAYCYKDGWDVDEFCCFLTTFVAVEVVCPDAPGFFACYEPPAAFDASVAYYDGFY